MKKWYEIKAEAGKPVAVSLFDNIGQDKELTVDQFMAEFPAEGPVALTINSNGGSVAAGLRIYDALQGREVSATVTGLAASMASVILMAAKTRAIMPGSMVFIHDPMTSATGDADELRTIAAQLEAMGTTMNAIYAKATGATPETVEGWMKGDTLFSAPQALDAGLVTEIMELDNAAAASVDPERMPDEMRAAFDALRDAEAQALALAEMRAEVESIIRAECATEAAEATAQMQRDHDKALADARAEAETSVAAAEAKAQSLDAALQAATGKLQALAAGGFRKPDGDSQDSAAAYWSAVDAYQAEGMRRNDAIARATRECPDAHKAMVEASNKNRKRD